ncbi:MAG: TetR/AcrR family transcriptional regulator [Actinomycetes bacterium]
MPRTSVPGRDRILTAALALAARRGPSAVTLDAVAAEADVSKGGLLYHFRSKDVLLRELVRTVITRCEESVQALAAADPQPSGRSARAYVDAMAADTDAPDLQLALFGALLDDRELVPAWRESADRWADEDRDDPDVDTVDATVARLAADGLWLATMLGLYRLDGAHREAVVARMRRLTEGGASA